MTIHVEQLTKKYNNFVALKQLSTTVPARSTLVVTGKKGAGKTTLLECIAGIIPPTSGRIEHPRVSYVPQHPFEDEWLTPLEFVKIFHPGEEDSFRSFITQWGGSDVVHIPLLMCTRYVRYGVALFSAVVKNTEALIIDEPIAEALPTIRQLQHTKIIATTSVSLIKRIGSEVLLLHNGEAEGLFEPHSYALLFSRMKEL